MQADPQISAFDPYQSMLICLGSLDIIHFFILLHDT